MQFADKSILAGTQKRESDGALIADVRIARTGTQLYLGKEVDPDNEHGFRDRAFVTVYRPGEEVFSDETMKSAAHRPVTNDHPPEGLVTSDTWKQRAVGNTADEVVGQGIYLRVPLMISDAAAIKDVEAGKREVSAGYTSILDWTPGKTPEGVSYDAVQRDIRFNHVAIVHRGRAGKEVRIGDEAAPGTIVPIEDSGETERTTTMANRIVSVDGIPVECTDASAAVIETLLGRIKTLNDSVATTATAHADALKAKDGELAKKDAENDGLKAKILDAAAIDKLVAERSVLLADAAIVAPKAEFKGLDVAAIRKTAVVAKLGDAAVAGKSDAYIEARFDGLVEDAKKGGTGKDTFRDGMRQPLPQGSATVTTDSDKERSAAYDEMVKDLTDPKVDTKAA